MRILGIDPGTIVMGYGVIEAGDDEVTLLDSGALVTQERSPIGERLSFIYRRLLEIIARYQPDAAAIEQPFMAKNVRSALAVGRAQSIAILAAAERGIPTYEYTPAQVKQRVTNYGASTKERSPIGERLSFIYHRLLEIISRYQPDAAAIEQPFMAKNVRSALAVGRAQSIAILAAAERGIPAYEYTPAQVKQRVTNYGASTKEQVQEMVRLQLNLAELPQPTDAADALAVALCHLQETRIDSLLARGGQP